MPCGESRVDRGWGLKFRSDLWDNGGVEGLVWSWEVEAYLQQFNKSHGHHYGDSEDDRAVPAVLCLAENVHPEYQWNPDKVADRRDVSDAHPAHLRIGP